MVEEDLSETVRRSVDDVNRVLAQLHEVNKQVRRFELQDKGKAVTYRDRRQALLEELSQLIEKYNEEEQQKLFTLNLLRHIRITTDNSIFICCCTSTAYCTTL